ncbi:hypothetical protein CAPTEDRAFT_56619, partial [Capitella teleta]
YSILISSLDFSSNDIAQIPHNFFKLFPNLVSLNLSANKLKSFPPGIGECRDILDVNLSENDLSELPSDFANCSSSLLVLHLSKNPLYRIPPPVFKCGQLQELVACDTGLMEFPEDLLSMTALKVLCLGGNSIAEVPVGITNLSNIESLDL